MKHELMPALPDPVAELVEHAKQCVDRAETLELVASQLAIVEEGLARAVETVALSVASLAMLGRVVRDLKAREVTE